MSATRAAPESATWTIGPHQPNLVIETCPYRYPPRRTAWKKNRIVAQAAGAPPKTGNTSRPTRGSTLNSRNADRAIGSAKGNVVPTIERGAARVRVVIRPPSEWQMSSSSAARQGQVRRTAHICRNRCYRLDISADDGSGPQD